MTWGGTVRRPRRIVQGYTDIGKPFIPPQPYGVAMTDRDDGKVYWLTDNGATGDGYGNTRLSLNDTLPRRWNSSIFGPLAGPYLDTLGQQVRLFIRGGRLGFESYTGPKRNQGGIITRRIGIARDMWEIVRVESLTGRIVYEQVLENGVKV